MDKQTATNLITQTFDAMFDEQHFATFARNLFNQIDESKAFSLQGTYILDAFKGHVRQYKRLGTYTDPEGAKIDVLIVRLKKETALDRARTMQRNFVARYLKERDEKDAALVAYYSDDQPDWRFSLVKMEYQIAISETTGRLKTEEVLTPARRYSFLVGQNEPNHTAQQQLVPILQETRHNPTLAQLEAAFNIESVTKEFFQKYKNLFLDLKDELDRLARKNKAVKSEFDRAGIDTANFAKKLLGQIVFLYFLQKKGWLGVAQGQAWGSGPKDFLRRLFKDGESDLTGIENLSALKYTNFFNDVLEPLFYEALAIERSGNLYPPLNCRIPFLNGGLFEPVGDYDWRGVDILLDNSRFRDIFETFDLFNFTVREDEPLEKEVAVDPEMLGKVFENLLDVTDRKSKGAFYTPREIVHYMCQESLINYLDTSLNTQTKPLIPPNAKQQKLFGDPDPEQLSLTATETQPNISREDIDALIRKGELGLEHDAAKASGTKSYTYHLPEAIQDNAATIDTALANIKICDPAIGSGAFPVGLMQEVVKARTVLTTYLQGQDEERTPYQFKRHAIQESIYGVDIDPGAVDIAKLRLWLSLVVDEESYDTIQPLPNLDYKIVCGNALLGVEKDLFNHHLFDEIERLKPQYFAATDPTQKRTLKSRIDDLIAQLTGDNQTFDFEIYFSEVFHHNGGFDVVIGNPPWGSKLSKDEKAKLKIRYPEIDSSTPNAYAYFIGLSRKISSNVSSLILPDSILIKDFAKTRRLLTSALRNMDWYENSGVHDSKKLFINVDHDVCVLIFDKGDHPLCKTRVFSYFTSNMTYEKNEKIRQKDEFIFEKYDYNFNLLATDADWAIHKKLESLSTLQSFMQCHEGIHTGNCRDVLFHQQKSRNSDKPLFHGARAGDIIQNYWSVRSGWYVDYRKQLINKKKGMYASLRDENIFKFPKIYITRTGNPLKAFYDENSYASNNFFSLQFQDYSKNTKDNLFFILAIVNSTIANYLIRTIIAPRIGKTFVETKIIHLLKIPVPDFMSKRPEQVLNLVNKVIEQKKANPAANVSHLEAEIDQLVYQLYGLTAEEIAIVEAQSHHSVV